MIYLVAGRMTVTPDGGESSEIGVGDMAVFPKGWTGTWDIHETVRKVYSIFSPPQLRPVTDRRRREIASTLAASSRTPPVTKKLM